MANTCAYCRKPGKITREHLYPQFLLRYCGKSFLGYNEAADKVLPGERVIRDVCSKCNNEALGALDGYGYSYFQANKLDLSFTNERTTEILYDYDLLLRWVLKISYNSFRTVDFFDDPFASLVPYILTGRNRPKTKFVQMFLEIIRGHRVTDEERQRVQVQFQKTDYIPSYLLCTGRAVYFNCNVPCHCRHFQLNAHRFTLFLFPYRTRAAEAAAAFQVFHRQYPFAVSVGPDQDRQSVRISPRDIVDVHTGPDVHPHELFRQQQYNVEHP
jgi:hypothetical protein